jgi:hypothetical protein
LTKPILPKRITTSNLKEDHYWLLNKSIYNIARLGPDRKKGLTEKTQQTNEESDQVVIG